MAPLTGTQMEAKLALLELTRGKTGGIVGTDIVKSEKREERSWRSQTGKRRKHRQGKGMGARNRGKN